MTQKLVRQDTSAQNTSTVRDLLGNMMSPHLACVLLALPIRTKGGQLYSSVLLQDLPGPTAMTSASAAKYTAAAQEGGGGGGYMYTPHTMFSVRRISRK